MNSRTKERSIPVTKTKLKAEESIPISRALLVARAKRRLAAGFYDCEGIVDAVVELILKSPPASKKAGRSAESRRSADRNAGARTASRRRQSAA